MKSVKFLLITVVGIASFCGMAFAKDEGASAYKVLREARKNVRPDMMDNVCEMRGENDRRWAQEMERREQILAALAAVRHPRRGQDVVALGMISGVVVRGSNVGFAIEVDPAEAASLEPLLSACAGIIHALRADRRELAQQDALRR